MLDTASLITAVQPAADRLRTLPESALRRGAAAEGLALARELAVRAQRLEFPGRDPLELPDVGVFAVGDQLLVAAHDLAEIVVELDADHELTDAVGLVHLGTARIAAAATGKR
ncbi:hypothetical protein [Streptomyces marispadix]|uniref:Uncharacterized protein n=1 Tax=Streptomyces marispadix TaxID=2922868 RepID=A0ABS9SWM2_9ACTN|nr:hypothetical protein [Streptomyces marispadix]MCH6160668.1 hypothetical protein [Streptomyces marispadix]